MLYMNSIRKKSKNITKVISRLCIIPQKMPAVLTTELYVERADEVHNGFYDYSKTRYVGAYAFVIVICPDHGEFKIKARYHTDFKRKCPGCSTNKNKPYTTETFKLAANEVHYQKYDYTLVEYIRSLDKVCIICPDHGEFYQTPSDHLSGRGCNECKKDGVSLRFRSTTEKFIKKAEIKHKKKYDYSKVTYVSSDIKVEIVCPDHGSFYQTPSAHLYKNGCPRCKGVANSKRCKFTDEKFQELAREVHGDTYTYSGDYVDMLTLIDIECELHGIFTQNPANHLQGQGCPECRGAKISKSKTYSDKEFRRRARKRHGNTYRYPDKYVDAAQKIRIVCRLHGAFFQTGHNHLNGQGCPVCKSSKGEKAVKRWLDSMGIAYVRQFTFGMRRIRTSLRYDFYLPEVGSGVCIEYDGRQHTIAIDHFGGEKGLKETQRRDNLKNEESRENGVRLLRVTYLDLAEGTIESKLQDDIFKDEENDIGIQVWYS